MFEEKYKTIGLNIMYYRRALNLTQSELAERAKMSKGRDGKKEKVRKQIVRSEIKCKKLNYM